MKIKVLMAKHIIEDLYEACCDGIEVVGFALTGGITDDLISIEWLGGNILTYEINGRQVIFEDMNNKKRRKK